MASCRYPLRPGAVEGCRRTSSEYVRMASAVAPVALWLSAFSSMACGTSPVEGGNLALVVLEEPLHHRALEQRVVTLLRVEVVCLEIVVQGFLIVLGIIAAVAEAVVYVGEQQLAAPAT